MTALNITASLLTVVAVTATIASLLKRDEWWIRIFDFPRLQITLVAFSALLLILVQLPELHRLQWVALVLLLFSAVYQLVKIFPYTFLAKKQVMSYKGQESEQSLSILISNVLTTNNKYGKLIALVQKNKPDLLLTLESDLVWEKELKTLEEDYPFTVKVPLDNFYGMHLYSRLELKEMEVKYLVKPDIPSIHGKVILDSGEKVKIHCLHPMPPSPTEAPTSTSRDAELLLVGKEVNPDQGPELVFGDLNDVAWSRTTRLFQEMSGLLDPRIGRGFFNTFHADHFFFRWPLDHVFHSSDFRVKQIRRLTHIGSDHFPIFSQLHLDPRNKQVHEEPEADQEEKEWADEKIKKANPIEDKNP